MPNMTDEITAKVTMPMFTLGTESNISNIFFENSYYYISFSINFLYVDLC